MLVNNASSVSEALSKGVHWLNVGGVAQQSRVGDVIVAPAPVLTVYENPLNRVLFSPMRDANPFFHVMESLWMLAGRNDLPWLVQFNKRFDAYSDDGGKTQPGAYGYRWRNYFGYDQLQVIVEELKRNPQTRRAVLAMWDGGSWALDYSRGTAKNPQRYVNTDFPGDLSQAINGSNDVPCNTHAYFDTIGGKLNMTVCCRSNDVIWGAYGANAVHFSFLLEYIAAATGIPMGVYRQFSNNFHIYTNVVPKAEMMPLARDAEASDRYFVGKYGDRKPVTPDLRRVALVDDPLAAEATLKAIEWFVSGSDSDKPETFAEYPFLCSVAVPMFRAWQMHKLKEYDDAIHTAEQIRAEDWKIACVEWLQRRQIKHERNTARFTEVTDGTA